MKQIKKPPGLTPSVVFWRMLEILGVIASIASFILALIKK